jgi:hypothetical protein
MFFENGSYLNYDIRSPISPIKDIDYTKAKLLI